VTTETGRRALRSKRLVGALTVGVPLVFMVVVFVYPLVNILVTGLSSESGALAAFGDVLTKPSLRGVAWFTTWQAVASTILTLVLAMPAAYVFARYDFPGRSLLRAAVTIPFVMPTLVVGAAFLALLGPNGALGLDLSSTIWAILLAHIFYNYAVVVRTVGGLWAHLDPRLSLCYVPRSPQLPRSSSCSRSPRSVSSSFSGTCSSAQSRSRSGGKRSGSSTFPSPPRCRFCNS
jgi:ABC-type sulfate transport system permease component